MHVSLLFHFSIRQNKETGAWKGTPKMKTIVGIYIYAFPSMRCQNGPWCVLLNVQRTFCSSSPAGCWWGSAGKCEMFLEGDARKSEVIKVSVFYSSDYSDVCLCRQPNKNAPTAWIFKDIWKNLDPSHICTLANKTVLLLYKASWIHYWLNSW